jgi:hypothetical protein
MAMQERRWVPTTSIHVIVFLWVSGKFRHQQTIGDCRDFRRDHCGHSDGQ